MWLHRMIASTSFTVREGEDGLLFTLKGSVGSVDFEHHADTKIALQWPPSARSVAAGGGRIFALLASGSADSAALVAYTSFNGTVDWQTPWPSTSMRLLADPRGGFVYGVGTFAGFACAIGAPLESPHSDPFLGRILTAPRGLRPRAGDAWMESRGGAACALDEAGRRIILASAFCPALHIFCADTGTHLRTQSFPSPRDGEYRVTIRDLVVLRGGGESACDEGLHLAFTDEVVAGIWAFVLPDCGHSPLRPILLSPHKSAGLACTAAGILVTLLSDIVLAALDARDLCVETRRFSLEATSDTCSSHESAAASSFRDWTSSANPGDALSALSSSSHRGAIAPSTPTTSKGRRKARRALAASARSVDPCPK